MKQPKDDLFDNSTMTFGEHLEELRQCLIKAIIWLAIGLALGLTVANRVVRYVADPLKDAIVDFKFHRDLTLLGYDDFDDPQVQALRPLMTELSLKWQVVYELPENLQRQGLEAAEDAKQAKSESEQTADQTEGAEPTVANPTVAAVAVDPLEMAQLLKQLPDPSQLKPKVQMVRDEQGLSSFKVEESFMIWVKAGLIVGAVLSSPMVFYHLWQFVAAGLHRHERKYVYIYLPVSVTLFISGVVLAFFLVLHYVLNFLLAFNGSMDVSVEPRLSYYINFVLLLPLGFGLAFQLPLVMLFLQRIGLIETEMYVGSWRIAVLVIFFLSMILTPADVTSMVALAVPLMVLYFLGILMCKFIPRGPGLGSAAYDPA